MDDEAEERIEARIRLSATALEDGADLTNEGRAARILAAAMALYEDPPACALRQALTDLRHACDLLGEEMRVIDAQAQAQYATEIHDKGGPAPQITPRFDEEAPA